MALVLHNTMDRPFGQFDSLDASVGLYKGGECVSFASVTTAAAGGTDLATADVNDDGYVPGSPGKRPAITFAGSASAVTTGNPIFLSDDGLSHYGTLFGVVVGATAGQTSFGPGGGTNLGPNTDTGSGKVTCWAQAGLYGTTLDAVDLTASTGLIPGGTNATVGHALYYTVAGLLTPTIASSPGGAGPVVGYFTEFQTTGSFVTSQQFMVAALNSPSGDVTSLQQETLYQAVYYFLGPAA